jgi:hypothetical protein
MTVTDSFLSGNSARNRGGGIANFVSTSVTVTDSTLSGNTASGAGSGIYNNGTLAVRGLVTIDGDYFQTAAFGTLSLNIGGTQAGTDYSQLVVNGSATLDGTLQVNLANGYQPQSGDRFHPLLADAVSGAFAAYTGDAFDFLIVYVYAHGYEDSGWPVGLALVA